MSRHRRRRLSSGVLNGGSGISPGEAPSPAAASNGEAHGINAVGMALAHMANASNALTETGKRYIEECIKAKNVMNMNGANLSYTHAQDIAAKLNLPQHVRDNITPFPGSNIIVTDAGRDTQTKEIQKPASMLSPLAWAVTGAGLLGAGMLAQRFIPDHDSRSAMVRPASPSTAPVAPSAGPSDTFVGVTIE